MWVRCNAPMPIHCLSVLIGYGNHFSSPNTIYECGITVTSILQLPILPSRQNIHCLRGRQRDHRKRNARLDHGQDFGPAGKNRRVGNANGTGKRKRDWANANGTGPIHLQCTTLCGARIGVYWRRSIRPTNPLIWQSRQAPNLHGTALFLHASARQWLAAPISLPPAPFS